jgi:hypothetical protein
MTDQGRCEQTGLIAAHALQGLPAEESAALDAHISTCAQCRQQLDRNRAVVNSFAAWPTDVLRPSVPLWPDLLRAIGGDGRPARGLRPQQRWDESEWEEVGPGIACKLLGTDEDRERLSMLVRELWIDNRKLQAGDYYRAEPGTSDERVWSETGCTCVLIASPGDILR